MKRRRRMGLKYSMKLAVIIVGVLALASPNSGKQRAVEKKELRQVHSFGNSPAPFNLKASGFINPKAPVN